ncbi:MAG: hypothetical protein J5777_00360 [Clostridiales bacterium]|nr:hypothetical protein [Clostridiales bacterium]
MNKQYNDPLLDELRLRESEAERKVALLHKRIRTAPEGTLRIDASRNKPEYYQRTNSGSVNNNYLPRKDLPIAQKLAQKDYDERLLKVLEEQLKSIEQFLKNYDPAAPLKVYENLSGPRKALVKPEFLTDEEYVKRWLSVPYRKMGFKANDPEFYTTGGERVRSKSEVIIAEALMRHNIPFRYEYPVYQDGVLTAVPDFNCLNVRLRKDYYWEHLGMLDDAVYADNNVRKLNNFSLNPDFDESRLILTTETKRHPLNTKVVEEKIRRYLL